MTFEKKVIDKILNVIKKHQVYLTRPENLPMLAKLGYMYNTLWYNGRTCWGQQGIIKPSKNYDCEDNPKYKIEMCEAQNPVIDYLIYDAWAMHVSNDSESMHPSWDTFTDIIMGGIVPTDLEKKQLKINKTFKDWVEILTNENYEYSTLFPNEKEVANHLLACFGTGFGYNKDGYMYEEAGGADEDLAIYGDWKGLKFSEFPKEIQRVIDKIMTTPEVIQTIEHGCIHYRNWADEKNAKKLKSEMSAFGMSYEDWIKKERKETKRQKYHEYYPISEGYSPITKFDKNTHISYIRAGLRMCKNIIKHEKVERKENIKFAKKFIKKFDIKKKRRNR